MADFAATLAGANNPVPTENPLGASYSPLLQKFYGSTYQLGGASKALGAFSTDQALQTQNAEADRQAAAAAQLNDSKAKMAQIQDAVNGKNFQIIPKDDGGFDYKDPLGNKISLMQYSKATGQPPDKVLADSNHPLDQQYVKDFGQITSIMDAIRTNDQASLKKIGIQIYGDNSLKPDDPKNIEAIKKIQQFHQLDQKDVLRAFAAYYPNVYGGQGTPVSQQVRPGGSVGMIGNYAAGNPNGLFPGYYGN